MRRLKYSNGAFAFWCVFLVMFSIAQKIVFSQHLTIEHNLSADHAKLKRAEALAQLGHWELDLSQNKLIFCEGALAMLGLTDECLANEEFQDMLLPGFKEIRLQAQQQLLEEGVPYELELQLQRCSDGAVLDLYSVGEYDPANNTIFGTFLNITERRQSERALIATRRRDLYLGLALLVLQAALIAILGVNMARKKKAQAHLQRNAQRQKSLLQIFHQDTDSVGELAEFAMREAMSLTKSDGGCLCLYDDQKKAFTLRVYSSSFPISLFQGGEDKALRALVEQRPFLDNNYGRHGTIRYVLIPIIEKDRAVAVIGLANKKSEYDTNDLYQVSIMMTTAWAMIARKQKKLALTAERNRLQATLLAVGEAVITTDKEGLVEKMNPAAEALTGWHAFEAEGQPLERVCPISPGVHPIQQVLALGRKHYLGPARLLGNRHGRQFQAAGSVAPVQDEKGRVLGAIMVFRDVTTATKRVEQIRSLQYHDELTGVWNRSTFLEQIRYLDGTKTPPLSLVIADIDGFKVVNEAFGPKVGDRLLQLVAARLKKNSKAADVVARWGGDEFIIALPDTGEAQVLSTLKRWEKVFADLKIGSLSVSLSFGWATKSERRQEIKELWQLAENRLAQTKLGKETVTLDTIKALMNDLYLKSGWEKGHAQRVSELCVALGQELGLSALEKEELKITGLFHDLGKIAVDAVILNKTDSLTKKEWAEIKRHPQSGYQLFRSVQGMGKIAAAILSHHEQWDGKGYPRGLAGNKIPLPARIVALAGAYDAMVSGQSYRRPLAKRKALREIKRCAGKQFDPALVEVFLKLSEKWRSEKKG